MTLEELKVVISAETKGLKKSVEDVKHTLNSVSSTVDKVNSKITKSFSKVSSSFKKLSSGIGSTFKSLARSAGLLLSIAGILRLGKAAVETASDLEEIQNVVDVAFGKGSKTINDWSKTTLSAFGLTELAAKKYSSELKAMSNSMGVVDEEGREMSMRLTELAGDLASFYNTSQDSAFAALEGVYTGQMRALLKYGIVLSEANLEQFALSKGIKQTYNSMSQAQKVALRYQYVMQATADAQGDFVRTSGSWANQVKVLKGQWSSFLGVLGTAIKQVLSPLLKSLNNILASIITISKAIFTTLGINFNVSAASVNSAAVGAGDLADNLDTANGSAKQLSQTLAGFDELNLLNDKDSGSGIAEAIGDVGSSLDIGDAVAEATENNASLIEGGLKGMLDRVNSWIDGTMSPWLNEKAKWLSDKINKIATDVPWKNVGQTVGNGLNTIIEALDTFWSNLQGYNIGSAIANYFNGLLDEIDPVLWGQEFSHKLELAFDIVNGFLETYDWKGLGDSIARWFDNIEWKKIGNKLATLISNVIIAALNLAVGIVNGAEGGNWEEFKSGFSEGWNADGIRKSWEELKKSFGESNVFTQLRDSVQQLNETISKLIAALGALGIAWGVLNLASWLGVGTSIKGMFSNMLTAFLGMGGGMASAASVFEGAKSVFLVGFGKIGAAVSSLGTSIMGFLTGPIAAIVAGFAGVVASMIVAYNESEVVRDFLEDTWENHIKPIYDDLKRIIKDIWDNHLKPLWDEIKEACKDIWEGILKPLMVYIGSFMDFVIGIVGTVIGDVLRPILNAVGAIVGNIIDIITGLIKALKGCIQFIAGVFTGDWKLAWEGVKNIFGGIWDGIKNLLKADVNIIIGFINTVISGIQSVVNLGIKALNKISIDVPSWVPVIGGKSWGFNISTLNWGQIPYLAKGGIIDQPTLAMLGEYSNAASNPEIAAPQSVLQGVINAGNEDLINILIQLNRQLITAIENKDTNVTISDDDIANSVIRSNQGSIRRTGKPLLSY